MTIALVVHGSASSPNGNGFTSGSFDTTGSNFLVVCVTTAASGGMTISDSKGNTWNSLTDWSNGLNDRFLRFFYAENPTVGSGHTFTTSGTSNFPSLAFAGFSGVATSSSFDAENGNDTFIFNNQIQPGSVSPANDNELLVAAIEYDDSSTPTIDSGFTITDTVLGGNSNFVGIQFAYIIETTAAAKNPTFSWTNSTRAVAAIAAFKMSSGAAVAETNTGFISGFQKPNFKKPVDLYFRSDVEPFFAVETNVHFLAKHVPTRLQVPLSLRQTHSYLPDVVSPEPHFVGKFTSTKLTRFNDLYFNPDIEPPVVETNVHFVGSFKPTKYVIDQAYRQIPDNQPPVIETNVHFVGTYKPTFSKYLSSLRQNADVEPFFAIETNTHFIAKFTPTSLKVLTPYRWFYPEDTDTPVNIQSETNINFIARFTPTKLYRNPALQQHYDFNPPVIETNVHFISTYKPTFSKYLNSLRQNSDIEPPVVETNVHIIGKFNSAKLNVLKLLLQNEAKDVFVVVPEPETNISFVAKFNPTKFYINSALRQHYDFNPPVVETNVSFVGKFYPTKFFLNQNLWQTDDIEPQVSETNVHFISSFKPTKIKVLQGLRTNPAKDTEFSVIVTANSHFLAKFKPTRINLFEQFRSCPANDVPTFVAKFNFFTQIFG